MPGPDERNQISKEKDSGLWFNVEFVDTIIKMLEDHAIEMNLEPETFYGRKVVYFKDIHEFSISFYSEIIKTNKSSTI